MGIDKFFSMIIIIADYQKGLLEIIRKEVRAMRVIYSTQMAEIIV